MIQKTKLIRALLVDDELNACKNLQNILTTNFYNSIEIAGFALNTKEAEALIAETNPEVLFLDIEMRGENAFQFIERIKPFNFEIVFVTAYDEYALRALKLSALDYILKPINIVELAGAIKKLEQLLLLKERVQIFAQENEISISGNQYAAKTPPERIILKSQTESKIVSINKIKYIEAKRSYSQFYFEEENGHATFLMSKPISDYIEMLHDRFFYRIHKSYFVNCNYIKNLHKENDHYTVYLKDSTVLPISRRKYLLLEEFLKHSNIIQGK